MISYGSICTGYDGIGTGLQLAGVDLRARWMAEVEEPVKALLQETHPGVPDVGDIKLAPWELAPHVALMSSGDPCQTISIAGRQEGRKDPRFLWPWVRQAYRAVRPDVLFFENVANIVSHDGRRTLAERYEHLQEDGYGIRWTVLGACAVGAPHHRHRWYAVASRSIDGVRRVGGQKAICGAPRSGGRILLPSPRASDGQRGAEPVRSARTGTGGTLLDAVAQLLPTPMADRSGNNRGGSAGRDGQPVRPSLDSVAQLLPTPIATNCHGNEVNNRGELLLPGVAVRPEIWGRYAEAIALWENLTGIPAPTPTVIGPKGGPRLNPELPEWMMGLPPGFLTSRMDRAAALKAAGNGVVPQAVAAAWRLLTSEG